MILEIIKYGQPVLRQKGDRMDTVTPEIKLLIADMLETMHEEQGIGLAAQQVGRALQLMVVDVTGVEDRPSTMKLDGQPVNPEDYMPMTLINPGWTPVGDSRETGPEGCLSFPEVFGEITRPALIEVRALDEDGELAEFQCGGLLARAIQHEWDHLQGILFIDRMDAMTRDELRPEIEAIQKETKRFLQT